MRSNSRLEKIFASGTLAPRSALANTRGAYNEMKATGSLSIPCSRKWVEIIAGRLTDGSLEDAVNLALRRYTIYFAGVDAQASATFEHVEYSTDTTPERSILRLLACELRP